MDPHEKSHESLNGAVGGNQTFVLALFPLIFVLLLVVLSILRFSVFALRCFNRHEWIINLEKLWSSLPNRVKGTECLKNLNIGYLSRPGLTKSCRAEIENWLPKKAINA